MNEQFANITNTATTTIADAAVISHRPILLLHQCIDAIPPYSVAKKCEQTQKRECVNSELCRIGWRPRISAFTNNIRQTFYLSISIFLTRVSDVSFSSILRDTFTRTFVDCSVGANEARQHVNWLIQFKTRVAIGCRVL